MCLCFFDILAQHLSKIRQAEARRKADEERRAAEAAARDIDLERNKGVAFVATLRPERSTAAEAKGIVRTEVAFLRNKKRTMLQPFMGHSH